MQFTTLLAHLLLCTSFAITTLAHSSGYAAPLQVRVPVWSRRASRRTNIAANASHTIDVPKVENNATATDAVPLVSFKGHDALSGLLTGNRQFATTIENSDPGLLRKLTDDGQAPPFMFIGCSDSRVSENQIFNAKPGTLFTQRNIANQFVRSDANANSVLAYAVAELKVRHVIVMGHYGCGGVAASIASPPQGAIVDAANGAVQDWIQPIRDIFQKSSRQEIADLRTKIGNRTDVEEPEFEEPGFMALVEENIKAGVQTIAQSTIIKNSYQAFSDANASNKSERSEEGGPLQEVFIHGWVYNIATGVVKDLGITVSPPGAQFESAPAAAVEAARKRAYGDHMH